MAGGWTRDGAVQDQIDDTVADAVLAARASMPSGASEPYCAICGDDIPEGRRRAIPGVRTCVTCQGSRDGSVLNSVYLTWPMRFSDTVRRQSARRTLWPADCGRQPTPGQRGRPSRSCG